MDALDRFEELIGSAVEGAFVPRSPAAPADLLRAARRALLRGRRRWFGADLAPNRIELRVDPETHAAWAGLHARLAREIGARLEAIAREQGLVPSGRIGVAIVADAGMRAGRTAALASIVEPSEDVAFEGRYVTPLRWTFSGRRALQRLVVRERGPKGTGRERLIVFAVHLVMGSDMEGDLCPPREYTVAPTVLTLSSGLFVTRRGRSWLARWLLTRTEAAPDGLKLRLARGLGGEVRLAGRGGRTTSASITAAAWALTLALGDVVIGRDPRTSDLLLDDAAVSASHARLAPTEAGIEVHDLGSANGLLADGERVASAPLRPGMRLKLGLTDLEVLG